MPWRGKIVRTDDFDHAADLLDTSFTSSTVYDVTATDGSFRLTERTLSEPFDNFGPVRRRGIGRTLLESVRTTAQENGARELWLETQRHNVPATTAYRRLGFRLTRIDITRFPAPYDDETAVLMSCSV
ncbi:MAG: GNAT family N-acetyltransferase [Actinomycetota bacterium]|nr:GNAT family N-acetyltransferase [Actinomycetota bacterium]